MNTTKLRCMARNIACKDPDHPLEDVIDEIADLLDQQAQEPRPARPGEYGEWAESEHAKSQQPAVPAPVEVWQCDGCITHTCTTTREVPAEQKSRCPWVGYLEANWHRIEPPSDEGYSIEPVMPEDELPATMPKAHYNQWYEDSDVVDGVRMGPLYPGVNPEWLPASEADRTLRTMWCKNCGDVYVNYACACCGEPILAPKPDEAPAAAEETVCGHCGEDPDACYCEDRQNVVPAAEPSGEGEEDDCSCGVDGHTRCHSCADAEIAALKAEVERQREKVKRQREKVKWLAVHHGKAVDGENKEHQKREQAEFQREGWIKRYGTVAKQKALAESALSTEQNKYVGMLRDRDDWKTRAISAQDREYQLQDRVAKAEADRDLHAADAVALRARVERMVQASKRAEERITEADRAGWYRGVGASLTVFRSTAMDRGKMEEAFAYLVEYQPPKEEK